MFLSLFYIIELQKGEWRLSYTQKIKVFVKHHFVTQKTQFWIDFRVYLKDITLVLKLYTIFEHIFILHDVISRNGIRTFDDFLDLNHGFCLQKRVIKSKQKYISPGSNKVRIQLHILNGGNGVVREYYIRIHIKIEDKWQRRVVTENYDWGRFADWTGD